MAYEILVLDIDGTLTNSQKTISKKTLRSLYTIQERGKKVVLASGRPTPGITKLAEELKLQEYGGYILAFNGAKIIDCSNQEVIFQQTIPNNLIPDLYQAAIDNQVGIITYKKNKIIAGTKIDSYMEIEAKVTQMKLKNVENFAEYIDIDVNKCLMTGKPERMAKVEHILSKQFGSILNIFRSEPYFLEIMPQNIDKAHSLSILLDHLGLSKEQMISCGDGFNDLSMIQYAGMGVAMANAQEVVKEAADYITLSNDEDGIAHVISQFMM